MSIKDFAEETAERQVEMEKELEACELEELMSPVWFIENGGNWIGGF